MREHVRTLKEEWVRYCGAKRQGDHEKILSLKRKISQLEFESRLCVKRHEYGTASIMMEERRLAKKQLDELLPISYETYATKEFAKDFKTVTAERKLTDQDRLFFRLHYYREYLGFEVKEIAKIYSISMSKYYSIYNMGINCFFPSEQSELISEVG